MNVAGQLDGHSCLVMHLSRRLRCGDKANLRDRTLRQTHNLPFTTCRTKSKIHEVEVTPCRNFHLVILAPQLYVQANLEVERFCHGSLHAQFHRHKHDSLAPNSQSLRTSQIALFWKGAGWNDTFGTRTT